uniref:Equatorin n=2 Tax=Molossus molossus TaxID=27622 RepID=A0A7J8ED48_MOLMO|nr:equatorin [Molossus molossus]
MNLILFIFLSGVFPSDINDVTPNIEEVFMELVTGDEHHEEEIKESPENDKNDHHYKDTKQYMFTTVNPNGSQSEISVRATTDLNFALKNYKLINETTTPPTAKPSEEYSKESSEKNLPRSTQGPNEPAFWTMLAKVLNDTAEEEETRDQLFEAIPSSDLNGTNEDEGADTQDDKLKIMMGISLLTLILFASVLAVSSALLYKLKTSYKKQIGSEYTVNPELASMSYFHPTEGVSDTSFSKSAESSTILDPNPPIE